MKVGLWGGGSHSALAELCACVCARIHHHPVLCDLSACVLERRGQVLFLPQYLSPHSEALRGLSPDRRGSLAAWAFP